jgi:hypothetical protein
VKKASAALMDVEAARDELLSRAELGARRNAVATAHCLRAAASKRTLRRPCAAPLTRACGRAGDTAGGAATSAVQRDRLLNATDKLKQTGDRIKEGKKTLLETEELGVSILQDLHKQRETIQHTRDTLHGADENIGRSRRILTAMGKRAMANKIALGGIIVLLLICIIAVGVAKSKK